MGAKLAWGLVVVVAILHYDFWNWGDHHLVFGFMPLGLAYHAGISLAAGLAWTLVVLCAWPDEVEEWAGGAEPGAASGGERGVERAGDTDRA